MDSPQYSPPRTQDLTASKTFKSNVFNPWWTGYVLAAIILIGLIVMIVLYFKKPCPSSCDSTVCPSPGTCTNGVCVEPGCTPCKDGSGTCAKDGTCNSATCDCSKTCTDAGLNWDNGKCTTNGNWSKTSCPLECQMTSTCPVGYWSWDSGNVPSPNYDPRTTSGGKYCKANWASFPNTDQIKANCTAAGWVPSPKGYKCCPHGTTTCAD